MVVLFQHIQRVKFLMLSFYTTYDDPEISLADDVVSRLEFDGRGCYMSIIIS